MKDDPIVREVREAGQKLVEESGGTLDSFFDMLMKRQAEDKRTFYQNPGHGEAAPRIDGERKDRVSPSEAEHLKPNGPA